jgi:DNA repair protein RadC
MVTLLFVLFNVVYPKNAVDERLVSIFGSTPQRGLALAKAERLMCEGWDRIAQQEVLLALMVQNKSTRPVSDAEMVLRILQQAQQLAEAHLTRLRRATGLPASMTR